MMRSVGLGVLGLLTALVVGCGPNYELMRSQNHGTPISAALDTVQKTADSVLESKGYTVRVDSTNKGPDEAGVRVLGTKTQDQDLGQVAGNVANNIVLDALGAKDQKIKKRGQDLVFVDLNWLWDEQTWVKASPAVSVLHIWGVHEDVDMTDKVYKRYDLDKRILDDIRDAIVSQAGGQ